MGRVIGRSGEVPDVRRLQLPDSPQEETTKQPDALDVPDAR